MAGPARQSGSRAIRKLREQDVHLTDPIEVQNTIGRRVTRDATVRHGHDLVASLRGTVAVGAADLTGVRVRGRGNISLGHGPEVAAKILLRILVTVRAPACERSVGERLVTGAAGERPVGRIKGQA